MGASREGGGNFYGGMGGGGIDPSRHHDLASLPEMNYLAVSEPLFHL